MNSNHLIVFVKAPRPGQVKTRLAAVLGPAAACAAYEQLVERLMRRLATLDEVELRFTPDDGREEVQQWLRSNWQALPQGPGDLGDKLGRAVQSALVSSAQRVVVIGSDCPDVTTEDLDAAWAALADHDVVLGPATDGGYWLIGLRSAEARVFDRIEWSTAAVLEQTLTRCREAGLSVKLLRELPDVDTVEDWRRFLANPAPA